MAKNSKRVTKGEEVRKECHGTETEAWTNF